MNLRTRILVLTAALFPIAAHADQPTVMGAFTSICDEDLSTGFNWEEGRWVAVNFGKQRYVGRKIENFTPGRQADGSYNLCYDSAKSEPFFDEQLSWVSGCYSFERQGRPARFGWCTEYYNKADGRWTLSEVSCEDGISNRVKFLPNGGFSLATDLGAVDPRPVDDYKDSYAISVGRCSVIS